LLIFLCSPFAGFRLTAPPPGLYLALTMSQKPQPESGQVSYRGVTYPWQCDQIGHMNITFYVAKFDEANWNTFCSIGITPSYLRKGKFGVAGVQQNITYKRELMAGDVIEIRTRILEIREKVIRFLHEMFNVETGELAALCEITAVHLDRKTRKSCPFPEAIRKSAAARV
ncbi:MAG TPA: thioesterase family protein, partial [Terriglobales bacterium]